MKKIAFSIIAGILIGFAPGAFAGTEGPEKKISSGTSSLPAVFVDQIYTSVSYPEFAKEQNLEGFVLISFHYDETGAFVLNEMNANDTRLADFVLTKMKTLEMCSYAKGPGNEFNFRFDFSLQ